jgi:hypothetical protein
MTLLQQIWRTSRTVAAAAAAAAAFGRGILCGRRRGLSLSLLLLLLRGRLAGR